MRRPMPISENDFKTGDIVVVPFPYTDRLAEKRRPALVVSNRGFNQRTGLLWVAMITSAENEPWPDDIKIATENKALTSASVIRIAKLATIDAHRVVRSIGTIDKKAHAKLTKTVQTVIA